MPAHATVPISRTCGACDGTGAILSPIAADGPDLLVVEVPCLEAGLHVLSEKPLAATPSDARAIVNAARRNRRADGPARAQTGTRCWRGRDREPQYRKGPIRTADRRW